MDWVTELPPSGYKIYNYGLVIVDEYSKTPIFLPFHKDETASDRDPKFTSALWRNIQICFGTKLSFSTAYNPQALEDIMRKFCAYGLELKDSDGSTHCLCTLITSLELEF
ncbi:hypothetical protein O181_020094 [Austropuccinia psidii MF-1]|uniref:Integrase catalytic domain-containing protein n=1 Tax=Austropuccinia psidii MF-1 TaxID=1389203 RepID=A0A9Q3CAP9_9BASI|nr:hypothetical protein [Austropuccinia psidii MF-1]